jgi:hypothetical protein
MEASAISGDNLTLNASGPGLSADVDKVQPVLIDFSQ